MTVMVLKPFLLAKWKYISGAFCTYIWKCFLFFFSFQKLKVKKSDVMPFIFSKTMAFSLYLRFLFFQMVRGAYNDPLISFIEKNV